MTSVLDQIRQGRPETDKLSNSVKHKYLFHLSLTSNKSLHSELSSSIAKILYLITTESTSLILVVTRRP